MQNSISSCLMLRFLAERVPFSPYAIVSVTISEGAPMNTVVVGFFWTDIPQN